MVFASRRLLLERVLDKHGKELSAWLFEETSEFNEDPECKALIQDYYLARKLETMRVG
jgi:hypothetical protein